MGDREEVETLGLVEPFVEELAEGRPDPVAPGGHLLVDEVTQRGVGRRAPPLKVFESCRHLPVAGSLPSETLSCPNVPIR